MFCFKSEVHETETHRNGLKHCETFVETFTFIDSCIKVYVARPHIHGYFTREHIRVYTVHTYICTAVVAGIRAGRMPHRLPIVHPTTKMPRPAKAGKRYDEIYKYIEVKQEGAACSTTKSRTSLTTSTQCCTTSSRRRMRRMWASTLFGHRAES